MYKQKMCRTSENKEGIDITMILDDDIIQYYDYIRRLAESKCSSKHDVEDLLSETFLAAYAYIHRGGEIKFPKTWLANTFMHKYNDWMRRKYASGGVSDVSVINIDKYEDVADDDTEMDEFYATEEAAEVRREILYLSQITREVLIRFYYNGYSVADIASQLGIPEGTVKSRLSAGRENVKKGLSKTMTENKNNIPGILNLTFSGSGGPPALTYVENNLIAQNLLALAYDKPLTLLELAEKIGIPTVYIEPILEELIKSELVVKTDGGKYYSDFIIYKPWEYLEKFESQKKFVAERFERFWDILSCAVHEVAALGFFEKLNNRQRTKLERYVILDSLQRFQIQLSDDGFEQPKRRNGESWSAIGFYFPGGYDDREYRRASEYVVRGGRRTHGGKTKIPFLGETIQVYLQLCEFDTTLWDCPARYVICPSYFQEIRKLLWYLYKDIPLEKTDISNNMLEGIDRFIESAGLLARVNGKLSVDIPVISRKEFSELEQIIKRCFDRLSAELGDEYRAYLKGNMVDIPKHLTGISNRLRYLPATDYIVMSVVRLAYEKGLHLSGVDYSCPPVILVCDES